MDGSVVGGVAASVIDACAEGERGLHSARTTNGESSTLTECSLCIPTGMLAICSHITTACLQQMITPFRSVAGPTQNGLLSQYSIYMCQTVSAILQLQTHHGLHDKIVQNKAEQGVLLKRLLDQRSADKPHENDKGDLQSGRCSTRAVQRQYKGSTRAVQGQYKGSTRAVHGQYKGSTRAVQGQYKGSTRAVQGQHKGSTAQAAHA
jgi:hypothetical protein